MDREEWQVCDNCKGKGYLDLGYHPFTKAWLGRETCTMCGGEKGWPVIFKDSKT